MDRGKVDNADLAVKCRELAARCYRISEEKSVPELSEAFKRLGDELSAYAGALNPTDDPKKVEVAES